MTRTAKSHAASWWMFPNAPDRYCQQHAPGRLAARHALPMIAPMKNQPPFADPAVRDAFAAFPDDVADDLLRLRAMIFDVAAETDGVGALHETLKWGQPAYLTPETRSGSTIRLGAPKDGGAALYAHCQTTIIPDFRGSFPDEFSYEGNRAVRFEAGKAPAGGPVRLLIKSALTYHLNR